MDNPEISVILPYRDAIKTLPRSIKSLVDQTFTNFELVLINDGSTDGSREFVKNTGDSRIRRIDLPASGSVTAMNEGIYSGKSKYIALIDPWDTARNDRLATEFLYLENHPDIDVVSSRVRYIEENRSRNLRSYVEWSNSLITHEDIYLKRFINATILHSSIMFRRSLITRFGNFRNGEFPEDYELLLRWMENGIRFAKLPEELTSWHDDLQRLSNRHIKYNTSGAARLKSEYFHAWIKSYFKQEPQLLLWKDGITSLNRLRWLERMGLEISGYMTDDSGSVEWIDDKPVFRLDEIPDRVLIICLVEQFDPGAFPFLLSERGLEEGTHFIIMG